MRRAVLCSILAALAALAMLGCGEKPEDSRVVEATLAPCEAGDKGLPAPRLSTPDGSQCLKNAGACPPEVKQCAFLMMLVVPDQPLRVSQDDPMTLAFGYPVEIAEPDPLAREKCKLRYVPTGDPAVWTLTMPAYVWSDSPRGCGTEETVTDSPMVTYVGDDEFTGYEAIFGLNIEIDRHADDGEA